MLENVFEHYTFRALHIIHIWVKNRVNKYRAQALPQAALVLGDSSEHVAVERVKVIVIRDIVSNHLSVDDVALAHLTGLVQSLEKKKKKLQLFIASLRENYIKHVPCTVYGLFVSSGELTCVSVTVAVFGASGLERETVYMISLD